jgi:starch synthase
MNSGSSPSKPSLKSSRNTWLVAAENGHLPGGKVGGVGDVIRDLPFALAEQGWKIRIITPAYGRFHRLPGARKVRRLVVHFGGRQRYAEVWQLPSSVADVELFLIVHALLDPYDDGQIYHRDSDQQPFATDASKFAFFNAAVAALVEAESNPPEVLHLHDWHCGLLPALRAAAPAESALRQVRMVFTIHNLAYQGIRPLQGHESSLQSWFPDGNLPIEDLRDPRYTDCVNFMAAGIRLTDCLNTVSPSYAQEITRPSNPALGFFGGEGLEADLQQAAVAGRLKGILNGCVYPELKAVACSWHALKNRLQAWRGLVAEGDPALAWLAADARPRHLLTSVGRLVTQKVSLFLQAVPGHDSALEALLQQLGDHSLLILLGNGEQELEQRLAAIAAQNSSLLFVKGYAEDLSDSLYNSGDLFLMPSSFEPCGISQMLAMRAGQHCVVHGVGGLRDTVIDGETGFVFDATAPAEQASAFVACVQRALRLREQDAATWLGLRQNAAAQRFSWQFAAQAYISGLYSNGN